MPTLWTPDQISPALWLDAADSAPVARVDERTLLLMVAER